MFRLSGGRKTIRSTEYEDGRYKLRYNLSNLIAYYNNLSYQHRPNTLYRIINSLYEEYESDINYVKHVASKMVHICFLNGIGTRNSYHTPIKDKNVGGTVSYILVVSGMEVLLQNIEEMSPLTMCWTTDYNIAPNLPSTYTGKSVYLLDVMKLMVMYRHYKKLGVNANEFIYKYVMPQSILTKIEYVLYRHHIHGGNIFFRDLSKIKILPYGKEMIKHAKEYRSLSLKREYNPYDFLANSFYIDKPYTFPTTSVDTVNKGVYNYLSVMLGDLLKINAITKNGTSLKYDMVTKFLSVLSNKTYYNTKNMHKRINNFIKENR